ncbi:30S ribosomal protein S20 [bacterium]|nr:30S ribosomal protein S20 [bacterium]MBU1984919.1 30S ribosomal protein S20 [bacterium]
MKTAAAARLRNRRDRARCRAAEKHVLNATDIAAARTALMEAYALMDRMVHKGLFHRNAAARRKAALAHRVNRMQA